MPFRLNVHSKATVGATGGLTPDAVPDAAAEAAGGLTPDAVPEAAAAEAAVPEAAGPFVRTLL